VIVALPEPEPPATTVSQGAVAATVQLQAASALTSNDAVAPAASMVRLAGCSV